MNESNKLRKLIREQVRKLLQEKKTFTGDSGTKLRVGSRDYDPRTGASGITISVDGSRPAILDNKQAEELIKAIKLNKNRD